jgi:hypothetical protein
MFFLCRCTKGRDRARRVCSAARQQRQSHHHQSPRPFEQHERGLHPRQLSPGLAGGKDAELQRFLLSWLPSVCEPYRWRVALHNAGAVHSLLTCLQCFASCAVLPAYYLQCKLPGNAPCKCFHLAKVFRSSLFVYFTCAVLRGDTCLETVGLYL